jgi:hypothetical protein
MPSQGLGGMGGMGSVNVCLPWKSGLTFDHVLGGLRGGLRNRETGVELHNLPGAMNDIYDTLRGSLVSLCDFYLFLIFTD